MGTGEVKAESPLQAEADRLRDELAYHEHRAKVLESPLISAGRFRSMYEALRRLEAAGADSREDALTRRAPGPAAARLERSEVPGRWPSVLEIGSERGLREHYEDGGGREPGRAWARGLVGSAWLLGAELVLDYRDGLLERAVAPRPGLAEGGLDVTANARTLGSIPLRLRRAGTTTESRITRLTRQALGPSTLTPVPAAPARLLVRGVVSMRIMELHALDRRRVDAGEPPYLEPAAAISASLLTPEAELTATRPLVFFAEDLSWDTDGLETHWQALGALKAWGFGVGALHFRASGLAEVLDFVRALKEERPAYAYPVEGGWLADNQRGGLGEAEPPPRVRLAFQTRGHEARVQRVYHAVGRTGLVFPISVLERAGAAAETVPVPACANDGPPVPAEDQTVRVIAGAIAPRIVLGPETRLMGHPEACPACATPLLLAEHGYFVRCPEPTCPGRRRARLLHLCGPRGLGLASFDVGVVDALLAAGRSVELLDLLSLAPAELEAVAPGRGAIFEEERRRLTRLPLWRVLYLQGLEGVGERVARLVASMAGSVRGLWALEGLGFRPELVEPRPWRALLAWLGSSAPELFQGLEVRGVTVTGEAEDFAAPLAGKRVLVLGQVDGFAPGQLVELLERRGAILEARPSRSTTFFVRGAGASEEAISLALHYGAPEVPEAALRAVLQGGASER